MVMPRFMISSLHSVTIKGQLEEDLVKNEAVAFLKDIKMTNDKTSFNVGYYDKMKLIYCCPYLLFISNDFCQHF